MNKYYYDLHIHSCLSPCAENDMTPNNIAGMGALSGLNIMALTDHNTSGNCPAFFDACKRYGVIPIAGMELTTAEDIHLVCLFEQLEAAMIFNEYVHSHILPVQNNPKIFGDQLYVDSEDNVIKEEPTLLISATDIGIEDAPALVREYGGICYPAHIDRASNGVIAMLGTFPEYIGFNICEFNDMKNHGEYSKKYGGVAACRAVCSSDAHYLSGMRDAANYFELDDEPYSGDLVRHNLFRLLLN